MLGSQLDQSGAWLPAERVQKAATATLDDVRRTRASLHEAARAGWTPSWLRGSYEDSNERTLNDLHGVMHERVAIPLRRLAEAAPDLMFVTARDFQAIADHYGKG